MVKLDVTAREEILYLLCLTYIVKLEFGGLKKKIYGHFILVPLKFINGYHLIITDYH